MNDFNRVATMPDSDSVQKGFMFDYIQENFPYAAWQPVGYAVMNAFESTFGAMTASAGSVRENSESFIEAVHKELGANAGHPDCAALVEKIRAAISPAPAPPKQAALIPAQP